MPDNRASSIRVSDGTFDKYLPVAHDEFKREVAISSRPYQPGDPTQPFRIAVHPWSGGLGMNRLNQPFPNTYIRLVGDSSKPGALLHAPLFKSTSLTTGGSVGTIEQYVNFGSLVFIRGNGQFLWRYDPVFDTYTLDKDFGSGKSAVDMCVFNNELIVAMGETEKIWKRASGSGGAWTQATDNTFAIALGVVGSLLFRAESVNCLSSAITAPLTLSSWAPSSPNQYTVGDTSWPIINIIDYQGATWVGKGDGMYSVDPTFEFHNQTPQIKTWPHDRNTKGAFTAHGSLWVPSIAGLLRVRVGSSLVAGPELANLQDTRWQVRGGVEFGKDIIYLSATKSTGPFSGGQDVVCVIKMMRDPADIDRYTFHELAEVASSVGLSTIHVSTVGDFPNLYTSWSTRSLVAKMGRAAGLVMEDSDYLFTLTMTMETGLIQATQDTGMVSLLEGVEVTLQQLSASNELDVEYKVNNTGNYAYFFQTSALDASITGQTARGTVARYTLTPVEFSVVELRITGSTAGGTNTYALRQEVYEVWLIGHNRPKNTDLLRIGFINDTVSLTSSGRASGLSIEDMYTQFRTWQNASTVLTLEVPDYDEAITSKFVVVGVYTEDTHISPHGNERGVSGRVLRVDFARAFPAGVTP